MLAAIGLGLRFPHLAEVLSSKPKIDFFEVHSENFFSDQSLLSLEKIRQDYPIHLHGIGLSIASTDPLNFNYLEQLKKLIKRIQPTVISDHLSWCSFKGEYFHDLLPFPYCIESLNHVAARLEQVQNFLQCSILLENITHYITMPLSTMTESLFLRQLTERTGCGILLDLNNLFVSASHLNFSSLEFLQTLPAAHIKQIHLAGYSSMQLESASLGKAAKQKTVLVDSHSEAVATPVWELYEETLKIIGPKPTLIEWDSQLPTFKHLYEEANKVATIMTRVVC